MNERMEKRTDQLIGLGLKFNGESFVAEGIAVHYTDMQCDKDVDWDIMIISIRDIMSARVTKEFIG